MEFKRAAALLIVGHGSTVNPDSSAPTKAHAAALRDRGIFADVRCAFWKEEPTLRDALSFFRDPQISQVFVVPNFISEGYFTQTVIPRELELEGAVTVRRSGQRWNYCAPVGNHERMTGLLLARARAVAPGIPESAASLLIVGHGTALNDNSAAAAKRQVEKIRALEKFAEVHNVYMEEAPLVSAWAELTRTKHVIVVPFFIADGLHSYEDIPVLLGIETETAGAASARVRRGEVFRHNPHHLRGRELYYASSIGTDPALAEIIAAQAVDFDPGRFDLAPSATSFR